MTSFIQAFLTHFTYVALVLILLAAGLGLPIPEDIPLITGGYLCNPTAAPLKQIDQLDPVAAPPSAPPRHVPHLWIMMIAGMIGVLSGDSMVYFIGRRGIDSNTFLARHLRKVLHSKRRERVEKHFEKHGSLTVFAGRFMPGLRSATFAMAGISRMSYPRFLLIDTLAAAISVPAFIWFGYHFAADIEFFFHIIDRARHYVILVTLLLVMVGILIYMIRRRRRLAAAVHPD